MRKYQRKPYPVEAHKVTKETFTNPNAPRFENVRYQEETTTAFVDTKFGTELAPLDHWIMKSSDGSMSIMRDEIFTIMYEEV